MAQNQVLYEYYVIQHPTDPTKFWDNYGFYAGVMGCRSYIGRTKAAMKNIVLASKYLRVNNNINDLPKLIKIQVCAVENTPEENIEVLEGALKVLDKLKGKGTSWAGLAKPHLDKMQNYIEDELRNI